MYLPHRIYDLTKMSECSIFPCRPDQWIDRCLTPLFRNGPIFECEVREVCFNGLSDPCIRSYLWKMLLRCYPFQPSQWEKAKETNKSNYLQFVDEFIVNRNRRCGKENNMILPNPIDSSWKRQEATESLGMNNESQWSRDFGDSEIRGIIWKDTERTHSDVPFFSHYNRNVLARILYVMSQLNRGVEYVQGMNELLAPLLYAFGRAENPQVNIITRL